MTRTLILMRHAKSSWQEPWLDDFDRPLNTRGVRSAAAVATWLNRNGLAPSEVITSNARRAVETWANMAPALPTPQTVRKTRDLYLAEPQAYLAALATAEAGCVLMIGHNPGIGSLAAMMVAQPPDHDRFADYPTAATVVMRFDARTWSSIGPSEGAATAFVVPRDLF